MADAVQKLRSMADRIEHNKDASFGGVCVIVLPDGESVEFVTLDTQPDVAQFISAVATRLQLLQNQQETKLRQAGFGGR